ncbi:ABC transporter permease [Thermophilibacter immobilis]|uniref:ABC transporter permease n=2 Tax=Thermophilibacter immobilis TaxID=2779519 RepID=A0A7S7MA49_9ACTN|nr:ABC transporter permease [Thermophilibacter immobilis]
MGRYVAKRLIMALVTLFVILLMLFLLLSFMPGSPFNNEEKLSPDQIAQLRAYYGLDKPLMERFFIYVGNMLHGDFGVSYNIQTNMPIAQMVGPRIAVSVGIGLEAGVIGALIGIVLGIVAALKQRSGWDTAATIIAVLGVSLPSFVFALALSYFLGFKLKLFPLIYNTAQPLASSVLPVIALSMFTLASVERYTRSEMVSIMDSDFMMLAKSKGLPRAKLVIHHALRNMLISVITVLVPLLVGLMTGSLVIEKIFSIPGLGSLYITAIQSNDYNVVLAISFIYSVMFIFAMLMVDVLYVVIDPRIRITGDK